MEDPTSAARMEARYSAMRKRAGQRAKRLAQPHVGIPIERLKELQRLHNAIAHNFEVALVHAGWVKLDG